MPEAVVEVLTILDLLEGQEDPVVVEAYLGKEIKDTEVHSDLKSKAEVV